ncbi:MAG: hypothetical protein ACP5GC_08140, partial [Thiomonas sp.]
EVAAVLGADAGQGYALAKPMPAAEMQVWLQQFFWRTEPTQPQTDLGRRAWKWVQDEAQRNRAERRSMAQ